MSQRYVSTKTSIYTDPDLRPWRPLTIYFYRYLYENDHVHGITGIGRIAADIIKHETKLTNRQIERAKAEIGDRVRWWPDGSYWVVGRAKHTCYTRRGVLHPKFAASAQNHLAEESESVRLAFAQHYPKIVGDVSPMEHQPITIPTLPTNSKSKPTPSPSQAKSKEEGEEKKVPKVPYKEFMELWNKTAEENGLSKMRDWTEKRKTALKQRWKNYFWRGHWAAAMQRISESAFLCGKGGGDWSATVTFFLRPDSVTKIIEGAYEQKGAQDITEAVWEGVEGSVSDEVKAAFRPFLQKFHYWTGKPELLAALLRWIKADNIPLVIVKAGVWQAIRNSQGLYSRGIKYGQIKELIDNARGSK